ncbi:anthranilate synthase component I [Pontiella sulfatireligans]|uniref:Anthranilate synthase component 1 n=1 Tax=Pontiella sulfatireligans TaxID=2750658 RepID=A0A6C2UJW7_9BACT|nr:anthranilate synthase component I [Pontiella sulfatireligans]VGO20515.1 Anthranilate synthase component 1 [Pontiella sulfatireligans]
MAVVPDRETFLEQAKQGNLVPVWAELLADQETPVSAYKRVRTYLRERDDASHTYLLESVEGGENIGRYSFIGGTPRTIIRAYGRRVEIATNGDTPKIIEDIDPLEALKNHMAQFAPVVDDPSLPRFIGGAVGFLGYDMVSQFEPRVPIIGNDDIGNPDMVFMVTDGLIVFDRVQHRMKIVANAHIEGDPNEAYDKAVAQIDELTEALQTPLHRVMIDAHVDAEPLEPKSNTTKEEFLGMIEKAQEYIRSGDVIQTVLSQRFEVENEADSLDVYRALRTINPSPYMYCLDMGESSIVGTSPEILVRCEDKHVEVRPIAGTRPRGQTPAEDLALEKDLLADPKECAEHIMLVDLGRNDIGRVCDYNSVEVPDLMVIERYSHVMHIVSDVIGHLSAEHDEYDVIRASFPAGTVSGAPKIRAMEIIAELEKSKRGPYAGAVGYFNYNGNVDSAITIRTVILDKDKAYVQAGAGIVADSVPINEYEETRNKARGMMKALALAKHYHAARMAGGES